jgi:hypothetical protein
MKNIDKEKSRLLRKELKATETNIVHELHYKGKFNLECCHIHRNK